MAKNMNPKTMSDEQLVKLAEKFGKIPAFYRKKNDIIAAGLLTEEEFLNLQHCPRSTPMESATKWPKIGGRNVYPLSGVLTPEETQMYYDYKKYHLPTGTSTSSTGLKNAETILQTIKELESAANGNAVILGQIAALKSLLPVSTPNQKLVDRICETSFTDEEKERIKNYLFPEA